MQGMSQTGKAFILILAADVLMGYHSEEGWTASLELLAEHYTIEVPVRLSTRAFLCALQLSFIEHLRKLRLSKRAALRCVLITRESVSSAWRTCLPWVVRRSLAMLHACRCSSSSNQRARMQHSAVALFVSTVPVVLDTAFKYWLFKGLNRIDPSASVTLSEIDRH